MRLGTMPVVGTIAAIALALGGCGGSDGGDGMSDHEAADGAVRLAVADAAERTGVDEREVRVVLDEAVTWPDGSLGCPQPDQFYTQALVEGYRIVVEADGRTLHYHGRQGGDPAYCAEPQDPVAGDGPGTVDR
ncbi:hypothetical protein [Egicoccus sp. AB-alg6-2]|uniref:hypothetical protein n=1 Tax=Egicoccus sp. AB-alg6-2 TaxID=3242692 RepID=UPI00359DE0E1